MFDDQNTVVVLLSCAVLAVSILAVIICVAVVVILGGRLSNPSMRDLLDVRDAAQINEIENKVASLTDEQKERLSEIIKAAAGHWEKEHLRILVGEQQASTVLNQRFNI